MTEVVGVRLKRACPLYYFDAAGYKVGVDQYVVVETARGPTVGKVVQPNKEIDEGQMAEPLKPIVRLAEAEDLEKWREMLGREKEVLAQAAEMVARLHLPMKPLAADYSLDGSRLTIFFKAERRVDFRALLRELGATFKTRVELRQVGARDASRLIGGFGRCGRPLCCASHLSRFETVSMRMAKRQNLPLNPAKISGVCGRLLCCLGFEDQQYAFLRERMPQPGHKVSTRLGEGQVVGTNPIKETVFVQLESQAVLELPLVEVQVQPFPGPSPAEEGSR